MKRSRKAAAEAGEEKYSTGKPCKHGHMSPRYTKTGICVQCATERSRAYNDQIKATLAFNQRTEVSDEA
jgi:hypothetical protein